jgi:hypothetical protein
LSSVAERFGPNAESESLKPSSRSRPFRSIAVAHAPSPTNRIVHDERPLANAYDFSCRPFAYKCTTSRIVPLTSKNSLSEHQIAPRF